MGGPQEDARARIAIANLNTDQPARLEVRHLSKRFAGVTALDDVSLAFRGGEVHAVIGENGAGKSTLMKIMAGVQPPDQGEILYDGKPVELGSVQDALSTGVALIHQELNLADNLDVGANIFLGREPRKFGLIDFAEITKRSREFLNMVGLDVDPATKVGDLTIGLQQLVEIAKALSTRARVLIMDEPTSSLSQHETDALFEVVEKLRRDNVTVIYISHRLNEVSRLADRVSFLRDGRFVGSLDKHEINHDAMVQGMVGRDISQFYARRDHEVGDTVLEVRGLRTTRSPEHEVNFDVRAGEMVGVAGLVGAGRSEMLAAIFGVEPAISGSIRIAGKDLVLGSCRAAINAGLAMVPEDRKQQGLILAWGTRQNVSLPGLEANKRAGIGINLSQERETSRRMTAEMRIKASDDFQPVEDMSGGNQQKVVIGKWLAMQPKVLLLDEPTRGVDIGAKQEIYRLMEELAEKGVAILFVSSELEEVLSMSDRVLVMHEGQLSGELSRDEASEESVMRLATGMNHTLAVNED
ncbi:Xylose import ATP-binding protein XylG [Rubripirellula amarantea]|uniref:Xylose import ATP-binding protein XylG n=1 Tax=Rubripirellula amarantea TaxID=2527999 RepID=A0A5C5WR75_9BACT|nr:sugar ABC transporter ATP-binding protein [Rubripirellula amarantea]TWT52543.1 Xylose import ATP-binding protein XylG [Rubripirellula amarantea]